LLLIIALVIVVAPVSAAVVTIDTTYPGGIAAAISAAGPGGTVILNPGVYNQNDITVSNDVTIEANPSSVPVGSPTNTIINGMNTNSIFVIPSSNSLTLENLALQNGQTTGYGGAIYNEDGGNITLITSTITNCWATGEFGGAIASTDGGNLIITSSKITNCSVTSGYGGAIYSYGIGSTDGSSVTITSSTISNCSAPGGYGGAIYLYEGTLNIKTSTTISNCSASGGEGGAIDADGTVTITSSTISNCSAPGGYGGAIENFGAVTITSSTISNCSAEYGGAIDTENSATVSISTSTISNCSTTGNYASGGAISIYYYLEGTPAPSATHSSTASSHPAPSGGGAIVPSGPGIPVTITASTISNCSATGDDAAGGAIYSNGDGTGDTSFSLLSSTIFNCSATGYEADGGAIFDNIGTATITTSTISNCSVTGTAVITHTGLSDTPPMNGAGGAIYDNTGTATITSSTIINCSATGTPNMGYGGGAIWTAAGDESPFTMQFCRIYNDNTGTAVVYSPDGTETIDLTDNWWGSNADPSVYIYASPSEGTVISSPWLVLGVTASPTSISTLGTSTIRANLTWNMDSTGASTDTSGGGVFVPDGIPVTFGVSPGSIGHVLPLTGTTANGAATTTFTPANSGTATVSATVDDQQVTAVILISGISPTTAPTTAPTTSPTTAPVRHGHQSTGGGQPPSGGSSGYTGPAPTEVISNPPPPAGGGTPAIPIPPSDFTESYPIGFTGLVYNITGSGNLSIDLAAAKTAEATITTYPDRVEVYQHHSPGVTITFWGNTFVNNNSTITGPVSHAEFVTDPLDATFTLGSVSGSVHAILPALTQPALMTNTISNDVSVYTTSRFENILANNNLGLKSVAYTLNINKVNITTGPANITFTIPATWVNLNGGTDAVHITRISEETGQTELLSTTYLGLDAQGNMIFRGDSPNGTSLFGLVVAEVTVAEETEHPNVTYVGVSKSSMVTNEGMYSWVLGIILTNPILLVPIAAIIAVLAYFLWWKRRL
jgi:hypothetical protein